jgi:hypothetical protein
MRKLMVTGAVGLGVCAVCVGAAIALGATRASDGLLSLLDGGSACPAMAAGAPASRTLDWDGSDHVTLAASGDAVWRPGGDGKLHITGDPTLIAHLRIDDGKIESDCNWRPFLRKPNIHIVLPGLPFKRFHIAGAGDLTLQQLSQDRLQTEISGSGSIRADGKVDDLEIKIAGSGSSDFGRVTGHDARVKISGSGDADIAPTGNADIHISGSGEVRLHSAPASTEEHVSGSGTIRRI